MSRRNYRNQRDIRTLRNMIEYFDGYAACYNADPIKLEKLIAKRKAGDEIRIAWSQIRSDIADIITLPDSSKEIAEAHQKVRIYGPLSAVLILASVLSFPTMSVLDPNLAHATLLLVLAILVIAYSSVLLLWYRGTRKIYRTVREYYAANGYKVSKQRAHIKYSAQKLIDSLNVVIETNGEDPDKYRMKLFHNDYSNILVLKQETQKNIGQMVYVSVIKTRNHS